MKYVVKFVFFDNLTLIIYAKNNEKRIETFHEKSRFYILKMMEGFSI